uniref:NADH-ubiquinone oxidoreductase chain 4 n=1 Tax=Eviota japonica TaxID=1828451 RepID=A0A5K7TN37_9GOBI|nr:NADH dehydrogenase subunit 4 [Eviota japonica]
MLKLLIATLMLIPALWAVDKKWLWFVALGHSLAVSILSFIWLKFSTYTGWSFLNSGTTLDSLSAPLMVLTCWLLPLMILVSQYHVAYETIWQQRAFLTLLTILQAFLILAFSVTNIIMFFVMFEATLLPTLFLITRWGNQNARLKAGTHFFLYTLAGSLPLLLFMLVLEARFWGDITLIYVFLHIKYKSILPYGVISWAACFLAFLIKLPLYGFHLWLPKAHVEAPIAGSMVLAAVLLKLGGYGMIRVNDLMHPLTLECATPVIALALWGLVMTSVMCIRQTDLKSLVAYSSIGHMGLVAMGILSQAPWGVTGAIALMIAHGLTSSALFTLASMNYERSHARTMALARGLQTIMPLTTMWWLLTTLANMALPPLPNFMAEVTVIASMLHVSPWTLVLTGTGVLITACYSLYMYLTTQRGKGSRRLSFFDPTFTREHLVLAMHLLPLLVVMFNPSLIWGSV